MRIYIGSDHAGFLLKEDIVSYLTDLGHEVLDMGTYSSDSTDYPIYAQEVSEKVLSDDTPDVRGIVICGSGIGVSISANRYNGIRAALCMTPEMAELSRLHNDSNVLALGARLIEIDTAKEIIDKWLKTDFEGGRHLKRINLIDKI